MARKHTEGPWKANEVEPAEIETEIEVEIVDDKGELVGLAFNIAQGRLMAAAPELLEVLQDAVQGIRWFLDMYPYLQSQVDDEFLARAEATIAKATE